MDDKERFERENEVIADIIKNGRFLTAKEGIEVGKWISEGLVKGLTQPTKINALERKDWKV